MFIADIKFKVSSFDDEIREWIENLMHALHHQGRIIHLRNNMYEKDSCIVVQCKIPEFDSLSILEENFWVNKLISKHVEISFECLGEDIDSPDLCNCDQSEFYIFLASENIPLLCGSCGDAIPLYRIPPTYEAEPSYYDIDCWNKENLAWSDIEFYSVYETLAQNELGDIDSKLNIAALELKIKIEKLTGKDCYYFLEELREPDNINNAMEKKCPKCGSNWLLKEPLFEYYDFKCNYCKILSRVPP
jgi:predicted  nucleic acid-binding Zn ribbon protein